MKKFIAYILTAALMAVLFVSPAAAAATSKVYIDNVTLVSPVPPEFKNSSMALPFRAVAEAIGVKVDWDGSKKKITATDGNKIVILQIGNSKAIVNGSEMLLPFAPYFSNSTSMIPARFFASTFGCQVNWSQNESSAYIVTPVKKMTVVGFYGLGSGATSSWEDLFGTKYPDTAVGKTGLVSDLSLAWYTLDSQYNLVSNDTVSGWKKPEGNSWTNVIDAADKYDMNTEMTVLFADDTKQSLYKLLKDSAAVEKLTDSIANEAAAYNGANLDFEELGLNEASSELQSVKDSYTSFAKKLSDKLKAKGLTLTLTLPAINSSYKGYDYAALGKIADRIIIMAYDYNDRSISSSPEPVNKVMEAVEKAKALVSADKLILGINADHETENTINDKVGIAKRFGLKGIAIWRLGLVTDEMWGKLGETITAK